MVLWKYKIHFLGVFRFIWAAHYKNNECQWWRRWRVIFEQNISVLRPENPSLPSLFLSQTETGQRRFSRQFSRSECWVVSTVTYWTGLSLETVALDWSTAPPSYSGGMAGGGGEGEGGRPTVLLFKLKNPPNSLSHWTGLLVLFVRFLRSVTK